MFSCEVNKVPGINSVLKKGKNEAELISKTPSYEGGVSDKQFHQMEFLGEFTHYRDFCFHNLNKTIMPIIEVMYPNTSVVLIFTS